MSGITGWASYERDLTLERKVLEDMTRALVRRGPDGSGVWEHPDVLLGHRLRTGERQDEAKQPFSLNTPAGSVVIVYDGQAYNNAELRRELRRRGHTFLTEDDAETVLRGYLEWGERIPERLNGMYAFAIWDARSRRLVLARDRMGLRPLYFYPRPDGVIFGSEPKAILANPFADRVVDAAGMCEIFSGFNRTPGKAIWTGMRELKPGSVIVVDHAGLRENIYWRLSADPHPDDQQATIEKARALLSECVRRQMPVDGSCCVLLSGGLDSSVITGLVSLHAREQGRRVHTFTVDFVDQDKYFKAHLVPAKPDTPFAHDVTEHLGTDHSDIVLDHDELSDPAVRRACVEARDLPVGFGDRDLSFYLICQVIRQYSGVALSGDGGGQTFGPYQAKPDQRDRKSDPWQLRRIPLQDDSLVDPAFLAAIGRDDYLKQHMASAMSETPMLETDNETDRRVRSSYYISMTRMPHWATAERRDRISASAGLEIRTPYFDHRLIQYLFNTPWPFKAFDGREKSLLRAVGADLLPASVKERKKKGYPGILHVRYTAALQRQVSALISANHPVLDFYSREKVAGAIREDPSSVDRSQQFGMERLLDLAVWHDLRQPTFKLP